MIQQASDIDLMELASIVPEATSRWYGKLLKTYGIMFEPPTETELSQFDTTHLDSKSMKGLLEERLGDVWELPSFHGHVTNTLIYRGSRCTETDVLVRVYRAKGEIYFTRFVSYNVHALYTPEAMDRLLQLKKPLNKDGVWGVNLKDALALAIGTMEAKFSVWLGPKPGLSSTIPKKVDYEVYSLPK